MVGDSISVVLSPTVPLSALKKEHIEILYHHERAAIATKVMIFAYINSEENVK
jgi:hypothetical protein